MGNFFPVTFSCAYGVLWVDVTLIWSGTVSIWCVCTVESSLQVEHRFRIQLL